MHAAPSSQFPAIDSAFRLHAAPALLAAALALGGCASAPLQELAQARATVTSATEAGSASAELTPFQSPDPRRLI